MWELQIVMYNFLAPLKLTKETYKKHIKLIFCSLERNWRNDKDHDDKYFDFNIWFESKLLKIYC